jgi:hypothetical protein
VTVDTTGITTDLAGNGLTANNGTLDVNVNADSLQILDDVIGLNDTITGGRTFSNGLVVNDGLNVTDGATVSGGLVVTDGATIDNLNVTTGASVSGGLIVDGVSVENTINAGTGSFTNLTVSSTPSNLEDVINLEYFNDNAIQEVAPGSGLSGGGSTGSVTLDVNTGLGLTISIDDVAMVWGGTATGLTFSNNAISANVDGTTIVINNAGELSVIAGSAKPTYDYFTISSFVNRFGDTIGTASSGSNINEYSRLQVFVNGLQVRATSPAGVAGLTSSPPDNGDYVEVSAVGGLNWFNSSYPLEPGDVVEVMYES